MMKIMFSENAREALTSRESPFIDRNVAFYDGPINHLRGQEAAEEGGAGVGEMPDPSYLGGEYKGREQESRNRSGKPTEPYKPSRL